MVRSTAPDTVNLRIDQKHSDHLEVGMLVHHTGKLTTLKHAGEYKTYGTAVFLVSSGGQCGDEQNMKISRYFRHL